MMKPLENIRILDIATLVAGPFAAASLSEFGAEVIKIEKPDKGDSLRHLGTKSPTGDTYWWLSDSRNKKSLELDLRTVEGADHFKALVKTADIVIENFRPGTMRRWGLGLKTLQSINPRLIMCSVTGFGQEGPKSSLPGLARIAEGLAGFTHLTGEADGPPILSGSSALADYISGLYGAYGILLALRARDQSGEGQHIDVALYEGILRFLDELAPVYSQLGTIKSRMGSETHRSVPHSSYECRDGKWVAIACTNDPLFYRLAKVMEREDMLTSTRYSTNEERIKRRDEVNGIVSDWTRSQSQVEVIEKCALQSVPCGAINNIEDTINDPQVKFRQSFTEMEHPDIGKITIPNVFPRLSKTPGEIRHLGRKLGEDNDILGSIKPNKSDL